MSQNANEGPVFVKCLNETACIIANNKDLLEACLSFRERAEKLIYDIEDLNLRQQKFKSAPNVPKVENGFMIGALKAHYFIGTGKQQQLDKLPTVDRYMTVSGDFNVDPGNSNGWLNAPPKFAPKGFNFLGQELQIKARLEEFHKVYFKNTGGSPTKINNIYGMPFREFYKCYMLKSSSDPIIPERYQNNRLAYKKKIIDGKNKNNLACAAQQLVVHIGDRVLELKRIHGSLIIPLIEICEIWFPSRNGRMIDRKWPKYVTSCPCNTCKIILPYLITYKSAYEPQFKEAYKKVLQGFIR